jgi:menaquinone-dependent protoporphyrinogen oxidase
MTVLVTYATAHGSTRGIAARVAERLGNRGHDAVACAVEDVDDVTGCDAVVLGSAVHDRRWLPSAVDFAVGARDALRARPVWLFSVSSVGDRGSFFPGPVAALMRRVQHEPRGVDQMRRALGARGHHGFAGAVERGHWPLPGHLFLRALGGRYGDHRDWDEVDGWADEIAQQLTTEAAPRVDDRPGGSR